MANDPDDSEGYKSAKASVAKSTALVGPYIRKKIPLDEYHTCPCCDGKGYVGIVNETDVSKKLLRKKPKIEFPTF